MENVWENSEAGGQPEPGSIARRRFVAVRAVGLGTMGAIGKTAGSGIKVRECRAEFCKGELAWIEGPNTGGVDHAGTITKVNQGRGGGGVLASL